MSSSIYNKFTEQQKIFHSELQKALLKEDLTEEQLKDVKNEASISRYCLGYGFNLQTTLDQIKAQYKWRQEYKPEMIRYKDLKQYKEQTFITYGKDKEGNPVQYLMLKNINFDGTEEQLEIKFREMVYNYELNTRMLNEPKTCQITTIVELLDGSISMTNVKSVKQIFDKIGQNYPERSRRVIVLNAGWTFSAIWYFVKSFLAPETIEKYIFIDGYPEEIKKKLLEYIDEDNLLLYNDKDVGFDENLILKREKEIFGE
eukprot:gene5633-9449_t